MRDIAYQRLLPGRLSLFAPILCVGALLAAAGICGASGPEDLRPWIGPETYGADDPGEMDPDWYVSAPDGSTATQARDAKRTFLVSNSGMPFLLSATIRANQDLDDDFIGCAVGFRPGDTRNSAADFLLIDWKRRDEECPCPGDLARAGLAVSRVSGVPTPLETWRHDGHVNELARARTLGRTGWQPGTTYHFRFRFTPTSLRVWVNDVLEIDLTGRFSTGNFAFYNYSQPDVTYGNVETASAPAPYLSWAGTPGFETDGVHPDRGIANQTLFAFKVRLKCRSGGQVAQVSLILQQDDMLFALPMDAGAGSLETGRTYMLKRRLSRGTYAYHFGATVDGAEATGPPTRHRSGPIVVAPPGPYLSWAGTPGFETDGVHPDRGIANQTLFAFKVRLKLRSGGRVANVNLILQQDDMLRVLPMEVQSGSLETGQVYLLKRRLYVGTYAYHFEANVDGMEATGPPTRHRSGPIVVAPSGPYLSWVGPPAFESDGVDPDRGSQATGFTFKVRLTDPSGSEPRYVRLVLRRAGVRYGSFALLRHDGNPTDRGRVYERTLRLPVGQYQHRFIVWSEGATVPGPPTRFTAGPVLQPSPVLSWAGTKSFENDGVWPNRGRANVTRFTFKVKLTDRDGDEPRLVRLVLQKDGAFFQELEMKLGSAVSTKEGRIYHVELTLPPGTYEYRFRAWDEDGRALGEPTFYHRGPLGVGGNLAITGVGSAPTPGGAQITVNLTDAAYVQARVLNIAGRPVRTLCRAQEAPAGMNTLLWNARSDQGLPVPGGTYLVEIVASTPEGQQARAITQVHLSR